MPEVSRTNQNSPQGALADEIDVSVSEAVDHLASPEAALQAAARELEQFEAMIPREALRGDGQAEIAPSTAAELVQTGGSPLTTPLTPSAGEDDELLRSVQELLSQTSDQALDAARETHENGQAPKAVEAAAQAPIETLDQELAGLADELIETELAEDPAPELDEDDPTLSAAVEAARETPRPEAPFAPAAAAVLEAPVMPIRPPPAERKPQPEPPPPPPVEVAPPELEVRLQWVSTLSRPLLLLCAAASWPLRNRSQRVRDVVGWNALWLAFLGSCVWVYIFFFRSQEPPVPSLTPTSASQVEQASYTKKKSPSGAKASAKAVPKKAPASGGH